jgi:carboxymethylenebutenolidase
MASSDIQIDLLSGKKLPAYLARAVGQRARAGIVLLQEIFGINSNMRAVAHEYASRGYDAIAPDLFWRQEPGVQLDPSSSADRTRAGELMKGLDQPLAVEDALAAADYLRRLEGASGKVGAVGYCLGGKLAYLLACRQGIDASVSYYGVAIQTALDAARDLACPLLLHVALEDHLCPPEVYAVIKNTLGRLNGVTILEYPDVGHAFARRGGATFDAAASARAAAATEEFLTKTLNTPDGNR